MARSIPAPLFLEVGMPAKRANTSAPAMEISFEDLAIRRIWFREPGGDSTTIHYFL